MLRSITDEIMYELMQLSGQEYVDKYAVSAKREIEDAKVAAASAEPAVAPEVAPTRRAG